MQRTDARENELDPIAVLRKIHSVDQNFVRLFLAETTGKLNDDLPVIFRVALDRFGMKRLVHAV